MKAASYGFRVVGSLRGPRRLVDASAAFSAYAACESRAEVDAESYLSAFQFGPEFKRHLILTDSTKGYAGPCWSPWLWWDIDRDDDLDAATSDARRLCEHLCERYAVAAESLLILFSGAKGYHVGLPTSLWSPQPTAEYNAIARRFAENVAESITLDIDTGVYDTVRAFRAPNSRHQKTGLHKRRVTLAELATLDADSIRRLAESPQPFEIPPPPSLCQVAASDWQNAARTVEQRKTQRRQRRLTIAAAAAPSLNRQTMEFIRDGATVGDRHRLVFSAAANLAEFGCPGPLAHALLTEPARDCGLPPADIRRQIDCGLSSVRDQQGNDQ